MKLELLINLIIILVIIFAVLKRLKGVASESKELKAPAPAPPVAEEAAREVVEQKPSPPWQPAEEMKPPVEQAKPADMLEEIKKIFQPEIYEQVAEEIPPTPEEVPPVPEEVPQPISHRKVAISKGERIPRLELSFRGYEVVKGIVMSEILGPPISMR